MVAAPEKRSTTRTLELIQGSLSSGRIARRSPWLGGVHRLMDGTLLGVIGAAAVLAGQTSQHSSSAYNPQQGAVHQTVHAP